MLTYHAGHLAKCLVFGPATGLHIEALLSLDKPYNACGCITDDILASLFLFVEIIMLNSLLFRLQ